MKARWTAKNIFWGWKREAESPFGLGPSRPKPQTPRFDPALYAGSGHALTIGKTGSGKSVLLINNLLLYEGSAFVVDPRGDVCRATHQFRRDLGQDTHVIDPFGVTGLRTAKINPLDVISLPRSEPEIEAQTLATTIGGDHKSERDPYWYFGSTDAIGSYISHLFSKGTSQARSFNQLVDVMYDEDPVFRLAKELDSEIKDPFARAGITSLLNLPDGSAGTRACMLSTIQRILQTFRSQSIRNVMSSSTVDLTRLLAGRPTTIYAVVPVERLASHGVFLRLCMDLVLQTMIRREVPPEIPTLVAVDEAAQIGPSPTLKIAATYGRSSGVKLWTFWQSLVRVGGIGADTHLHVHSRIRQALLLLAADAVGSDGPRGGGQTAETVAPAATKFPGAACHAHDADCIADNAFCGHYHCAD
ncbi:MAG: type IV secretory system conjugative DNA transfer family protein [Tepidisphaeraceae bacterium]